MKVQVRRQHNLFSTGLIELKASRFHLVIMLMACGCALASVMLSTIIVGLKLLFSVCICIHAIYCNHRWRQLPNKRVNKRNGHWYISNRNLEKNIQRVKSCYYWSRWLIILRVEDDYQRVNLLAIFADSCSDRDFHRLRLISRFDISHDEQ